RANPPAHYRAVVPLPKVRQSNADVLLFTREAILLPEATPSVRSVVCLRCSVGLIGRALDELSGLAIDDDTRRPKVNTKFENEVNLAARRRAQRGKVLLRVDDACDGPARG